MSTSIDKGRDLEQRMAAFLRTHGYEVSTNLVIAGRSGANHELDVVGDKADGLTTVRIVVECKAWASPIDKDVVYKLSAELADLGAAKGVIASLSGWTVQAGQAAAQANIELWGPEELAARLGNPALSEMQIPRTQVLAEGFAFAFDADVSRSRVERLARGTLGIGREEIAWFGPIWLPIWSLQLALTRIEGHFKRVPRVTRTWNGYEGLTGRRTYSEPTPPPFVPVDLAIGHLRPTLSAGKVAQHLVASWSRWRQVTTDVAKKRHAENLAKLGIRVPVHELKVETSAPSYHPLWCGLLYRGSQERIVVIDGVNGREHAGFSHALTANAQHVRDCMTISRSDS
jgi:hypothetical protein